MNKYITLIAVFAVITFGSLTAQSYKVIVNNSNTVTTITKKDLSNIFLKKKTKWANGAAISPIDQTINSKVRASFTTEVHGRKIAAIRSYWQQAIFSGTATAPIEKSADNDVVKYVKDNAGAIGYVSSSTNVQGVKVVKLSK